MSDLGKPRPHTAKEIRQRREKVLILMSKGYNQSDIAKELRTTRQTIMKDIHELNQWTRKGLYSMAKESLSTMYYSCLIGINEAEKEAWRLYKNDDKDPTFNNWHKMYALRLLIDINKSKFRMFSDGPAFMEINKLNGELDRLKKSLVSENRFKPFIRPAFPTSTDDERKARGELTNALGVNYKIAKIDDFDVDDDDDDDSSRELEKEEEEDEEKGKDDA